jgi:hypothetical protein
MPTTVTLTTPNRINRETQNFFDVFGQYSQTCEEVTLRLTQAEGQMTDNILAKVMVSIADRNVNLDSHFHNGVIPLMTKYVKIFNSENSEAFTDIVVSAGELGVQDPEFWRAVKETLVINRMDKFIETGRIGEVIRSMAIVGQADENTLQLLGDQVIKHKRFIDEEAKTVAKQGFQIAEIGFAEFKRALEDDDENELATKE